MAHRSSHIIDMFADMATSRKPLSVSGKAWPLLQQLGDERRTRIFAEHGFLMLFTDTSMAHEKTAVFDRISSDEPGGVFVQQDDPASAEYVRLSGNYAGAVWFDPHTPETIHFNEELRPRDAAGLVFLSPMVLLDAQKNVPGSEFATETRMVERAVRLMDARAADHLRSDLTRVAHAMGMPRLKAVAEQYRPKSRPLTQRERAVLGLA